MKFAILAFLHCGELVKNRFYLSTNTVIIIFNIMLTSPTHTALQLRAVYATGISKVIITVIMVFVN